MDIKKYRSIAYLLCACLLFGSLPVTGIAQVPAADISYDEVTWAVSNEYDQYYASVKEKLMGKSVITAQPLDSKNDGVTLNGGESADIVFSEVPEGLYIIKIMYAVMEKTVGTIEYSLYINGDIPFFDCNMLELERLYFNGSKDFDTDSNGNQLPAVLQEQYSPQTASVKDPAGYYNEPYVFYLLEGESVITITSLNIPFTLISATLSPIEVLPSYKEYLERHSEKADNISEDERIVIPAEMSNAQNDKSVNSFCDKTSAAMQPVAEKIQVQNAFGGAAWSVPGQAVTWEFYVAQSGFYHLNFKARQDYSGGLFISRKLYIDGACPFAESEMVRFPYSSGWKSVVPSDADGNPYLYYLEKGTHTLMLECVLGEINSVVRGAKQSVNDLNEIYRRIIMITSTNPDPLRDYLLEEKIPEIFTKMEQVLYSLKQLRSEMMLLSGSDVQEVVLFDNLIRQTEKFLKDSGKISKELSNFQGNISSLGTWIYSRYQQPLDLDYIEFFSVASNPQPSSFGFLKELIYQIKLFCYSFTGDYTAATNPQDGEKKVITVWISAGRDQMQVFKRLADDYFAPDNDIEVHVKLVQGALLSAVVAGLGPDVSIFSESSLPVNFAMRSALVDLKSLDGYDEVEKRFYESAITPFRYLDGVYAIPETQTFSVLFYRKDILSSMKLAVPETWDEFYGTLAELAINNMQFGMTGYQTFLYQNDGELYLNGGKESGLGTQNAEEAFETWTNMYTDYGLPVSYDFANRFRSGEMPIGIADYSTANLLSVFAPEIRGQWGITMVPGTKRTDGTVNRSVSGISSGAVIIKGTEQLDAAWRFVKWWTDSDTQIKYGTQVEERLGASARYMPANIEAFEEMAWSAEIKQIIKEQWKQVRGNPEVPGGYYTDRHLNNAFRKVVYNNRNPVEVLGEYVEKINAEIKEKRAEFGLN